MYENYKKFKFWHSQNVLIFTEHPLIAYFYTMTKESSVMESVRVHGLQSLKYLLSHTLQKVYQFPVSRGLVKKEHHIGMSMLKQAR